MKILNLCVAGNVGGIENLCKDIVINSSQDHRICFLFENGDIYEELKKMNKKVFSTAYTNKKIFKIVKILYKYCKENKIDVVILHHGSTKGNIIFLILKRLLKEVKFVRYNHGCFDKFSKENNVNYIQKVMINHITSQALKKSDLNIYISNASKESFANKFNIGDDNKNIVVYNGISNNFFSEKDMRKDDDIINIAYVGRLEKVKGVDILIDAFSKLQKSNNKVKLTVTGYGAEKDNLEKQVEKLKLNKYVSFTGKQTNVIPILDKSQIFVYPTVGAEGFGISVIEAMARGCIPIVFNKGGLPEIIKDEENGIIVNKTNKEGLEEALKKVIEMSKKQKEEMIKKAKERSKEFTIEKTIENLENVIQSI